MPTYSHSARSTGGRAGPHHSTFLCEEADVADIADATGKVAHTLEQRS